MERKRKLPARAAARVEHASKKRNSSPPERLSGTPAPPPATVEEPPPPPPPQQLLPRSVQPGKPLPTVEDAQSEDLPANEYQSLQESGVLAESLKRSREKWLSESIFEKYWMKPSRKKGVVSEDPNNPPKDSMVKLGQVTVTIEPHVFDATIYAVKDPKPPLPPANASFRPIIQYGPPNGAMPPPPTPSPAPTTPVPAPLQSRSQTPTPATAQTAQPPHQPVPHQPAAPPPVPPPQGLQRAPVSAASASVLAYPQMVEGSPMPMPMPVPMPMPMTGSTTPQLAQRPPPSMSPATPHNQPHNQPTQPVGPQGSALAPSRPPNAPPTPHTQAAVPPRAAPTPPPATGGASTAGRPAPAAGTDPIIVTLAERATEDPDLRDLMKRVAQGDAPKHELQRFQAIIDQITAESRRKGTTQGPSADRLLVDGRTVRYFADEVRAILDIVFSTNPRQTSADLRPPPGSDPLVVLLVKTALDESRIKDMVRRIAENRPQFNDATDLKGVLDRLRSKVLRDRERQVAPAPVSISPAGQQKPNGLPNGHAHQPPVATPQAQMTSPHPQQQPPSQQALRSKGPPPAPKPDIAAVVFEFAGGSGDRYKFPRFSILEYLPGAQQVIASFLIVRKGSATEHESDPALDYYQPVTVRIFSPSGRWLDSLARVVAPQDEVRRYMDDVMRRMTRAEYVLLAMRLPRGEKAGGDDPAALLPDGEQEKNRDKDKDRDRVKEAVNGSAHKNNGELQIVQHQPAPQGVLWTTKATSASANSGPIAQQKPAKKMLSEDEQYQNFIATIMPREVEED